MTLILALFAPRERAPISASQLTEAFGVPDDGSLGFELGRPETGATCLVQHGGEPDVELQGTRGLVRTGWRLLLPTVRAPFTARDLLPAAHAAARALGARWSPVEGPLLDDDAGALLDAWDALHRENARALLAACDATGAPPPPHRRGADLERLHAILVALGEPAPAGVARPDVVYALDPASAEPTLFAARLPLEATRCRLPLVDVVLADLEATPGAIERPRVYELGAIAGGGGGLFVEIDVDEDLRERLRGMAGEDLARFRIVTPVEVLDDESLSFPDTT